jgi:hypothetical protein
MLYESPWWISDRNPLSGLDYGAGTWKPASGTGMGFNSLDHHHWLRSCKLLDLPPASVDTSDTLLLELQGE